jgi:hypothetical protein
MSQAVVRPVKHKAEGFIRWLICLIPLLFSGCFHSQSAPDKSKPAKGVAVLSQFLPSGSRVSKQTSGSSGISEIAAFMPGNVSSLRNIADNYPKLIALPDSIGTKQYPFQNALMLHYPPPASLRSSNTAQRKDSSLNALAALMLGDSFNQLFASVFKMSNEDFPAVVPAVEFPNPFTEAKQQKEAAASQPENKPSQAEKPAAKEPNTAKGQSAANDSTPQSPVTPATPVTPPAISAGGDGVSEYALVIGDFNGSGVLAFSKAIRVGDTGFASSDGEREFDLFINSDAAELQSAFCVDDLNGDGIPDLLVTAHSSLFGGVLLGNGNGDYQLTDKFVTGYEPTVPSAGPFWNGEREIVTMNTRTGELILFQMADQYHEIQKAYLPFVPDFLLHLIDSNTSADFLLTSQSGGAKQLLNWKDDGSIQLSSDAFAGDPFVFTAAIGTDSVQAYQVGNYASIVLSSSGHSFNVANMRVFPQIFLVIGDLQNQGSTDVAVGYLRSFTPAH